MMNDAVSPETPLLRVMSIQRFSLHDGPGIRTTVFLQGCFLHCPWCCNPESQPLTGGKMISVAEVLSIVERDRDYYRNSGGGVTFSGGEAFLQGAGLLALLKASKAAGLHTAVETSGAADGIWLQRAEPLTDLFLYDLKHCREDVLRRTTGADLPTVLRNLSLVAPSRKVIVRIPCIPGFNLDADTLQGIFDLVLKYGIRQVHLLPYHTLGIDKYARLGRDYAWSRESLRKEDLEGYAEMARRRGLTVRIGG